MVKNIRLFLFLVCLHLATPALAQCPDQAEQTLYNVRIAAHSGQIKDATKVFGYAKLAMEKCTDRSHVQGLAADLFMLVGSVTGKREDRSLVYGYAYQAILNNGQAWTRGKNPKVKNPDGSEQTLYTYGGASNNLSKLVPILANLHMSSFPQPIFNSGNPATTCPHFSESRVQYEADALTRWAATNMKRLAIARPRILALYKVCIEAKLELSNSLATVHKNQAKASADLGLWGLAVHHTLTAIEYAEENQTLDKNTWWTPYEIIRLRKQRDEYTLKSEGN